MYARICSQAYKAYACMLVYALKHTVCVRVYAKCWRHTLYALRAYICLTDAYICSMYASGYTCLPVWVYIKTVIPFVLFIPFL
jgi:hypothetical protein